jgi:hypothetical protein
MISFEKGGFMESESRTFKRGVLTSIFLILLSTNEAFSSPRCLDISGNEIPNSNQRVLDWKESTANQFLSRAKVEGVIQDLYPIRNGHYHFQIKIGPKKQDTLELVYNIHFGEIDRIVPGMTVVACGDYITSNAPTQVYEPSPDGAILHWIHRSPNPARHPSGYVELNGIVYGKLTPTL